MSSPTATRPPTSSPTRRPRTRISSSSRRWWSSAVTIAIAVETPLQDDVRAMVAELNEIMIPLTPREFQFQLTAEQMADPGITVFLARDEEGQAVAMGALKDHGGSLGEVKRMYTRPVVRGQRVGSAILKRI